MPASNQQMTLAKQGAVGIAVSRKPAHVIFDSAVPLSSLIEPTMHKDHKIYNILKWTQHSQCWSGSPRSFRLLFSAEAANPEAKPPQNPMPRGCKNTAFDLPKFTSQLYETTVYPMYTVMGRCQSWWERDYVHRLGMKRNLPQIISLSSETVPKHSGCSRRIHTAEILHPFNPVPKTHRKGL